MRGGGGSEVHHGYARTRGALPGCRQEREAKGLFKQRVLLTLKI